MTPTNTQPRFLPGVSETAVLAALGRSPGNKLASGKFDAPESSDALAANAFGWFLERPTALPPLPGVPMGQPEEVQVEAEMHLPWRGGRHPWLDVAITTATTLVGIEANRYEPFRPRKATAFTEPFASREWGPGMARFNTMRRALDDGSQSYRHLDAVQLVKHAYGLRTQAVKRARGAVLVYLYGAPLAWSNGKPLDPALPPRHEAEVVHFATAVAGADVAFVPLRWRDLLAQWADLPALASHVAALTTRFGPL